MTVDYFHIPINFAPTTQEIRISSFFSYRASMARNLMILHCFYLYMLSQYSSYDMTWVLLPTAFFVSLARKSHVMCKRAKTRIPSREIVQIAEEYYDITLFLSIYDITIFLLWYDTSPTTHRIFCVVGQEITRDVQKCKTMLPSHEIVQVAEGYYDITLFLSIYDITRFVLWHR